MEEIEPTRQDGVKSAASGFPFLLLKSLDAPVVSATGGNDPAAEPDPEADPEPEAVKGITDDERAEAEAIIKALNAQGGVDEAPDIANAEHVLTLLGKLMAAEADEFSVGNWNEIHDIGLLADAACSVQCFLWNEQAGMAEQVANKSVAFTYVRDEQAVYKRHVSAAERKKLAEEGNALPDGSYPIANAEDLHNAAILARSGHGDVAAAKKLIAKRARELGVDNPLEHDASKASAEGETSGDEVSKELDDLRKAHAEAIKAVEDERDAVKAELAKVLATPIPGGPVIAAPGAVGDLRESEQRAIQAARYSNLAKEVNDPELKRYYRDKAAELRSGTGNTTQKG
jgi:hypothetical protein